MGTTRSKRNTKTVDWSLVPRGPVSATVQAGLGLATASAIGNAVHLSPIWGVAAAAVGALGTALVSAHRHATPTALIYRMSCWAGAGGWLTWTLVVSPFQRDTLVALAVEMVAFGITAPFANHTRPAGQHTGSSVVLAGGGKVGRSWAERIYRVCRIHVTVTDIRHWQTGTGYDVHVDLPTGGATKANLERGAAGLAADARLPIGCGVEVANGYHYGSAILRVSTVNRLYEDIPQPDDLGEQRTILEPVPLGEYHDGSVVSAPLRELSGLVVGQKGSGKTNLLDLFTLGVGLCRDALVWHIDLNGGGMSQQWLHPWLEDECDRPSLDWAACTPGEALLMVEAALAIAKDRKKSYRKLKIAANSRLLPISRRLPEIVIIVDEGKTVLAPTARGKIGQIRDGLHEIQEIARDAGVNVVASALRGVSTTINPDFKAQSGLKICTFVDTDAELAYVFDWNRGITTKDLPTPGCAFIQYGAGGTAPRAFKARLIKPLQIVNAALQIAEQRPELDEAGIAAAGEAYLHRYARMREHFTGDLDDEEDDDTVYAALPSTLPPTFDDNVKQGVPVPRSTRPAPSAADWPTMGSPATTVPTVTSAADWADPADLVTAEARRPVLVGAASEWPDLFTAGPAPAAPPASPAHASPAPPADARGRVRAAKSQTAGLGPRPVPQILTDLESVYAAHRTDRLHTHVILALLGQLDPELTAKKFSVLMESCGIAPAKEAFGPERRRGYLLADVQAAIQAIGDGSHIPPRDIYAWPPTN